MKKRDFILAGLILLAAPVSAQNGPTRTPQDSKLVFEQTFEADFQKWSETLVDSIVGVDYYMNKTAANANGITAWKDTAWQKGFVHRDTVIYLYNGVLFTDDKADIDSNAFYDDNYTIAADGADLERNRALSEFGVDGGSRYFRYSAGNGKKVVNYSNGSVPNYRRNLFVRGLPIENETSYRLTVYVKATKMGSTSPNFYADVMRGYFSSEKPFTMGLEDKSSEYKYNKEFTYQKNNFESGEWTKIVFMTYYLNDSIATNYVLSNGYWWCNYWKWKGPEVTAAGYDSLSFIRQPDKFFVRLSFASDSTVFEVDNLSLTKSWIGGVEHSGDMIRVDFGYQTNLGALAKAEEEANKIDAVELPGDYFVVWGKDSATHRWSKVDIASAEYHGDGYMYMWTKARNNRPVKFDAYDSVLVSFTNPTDPKLQLVYNGDRFPKALDTEWIKAGKRVPDFFNEASIKNPNIGKGVYSMKNLPPVLQKCGYEEGSFNLDPDTKTMSFKFSRKVEFDQNADESTNLAILQLYQDGVKKENWFVSSYGETDSVLIFKRPAAYTEPLKGDYEFRLLQIKGLSTEYANGEKPFIVNYSFGESTIPDGLIYRAFDSDAIAADYTTQSCPVPDFSSEKAATNIAAMKGDYSKALLWGLFGKNTGAGNNATDCAKLFFHFTLAEDGDYEIFWGLTGCANGAHQEDADVKVILYTDADDEIGSKYLGPSGIKQEIGGKVTAVKVDSLTLSEMEAGDYKLAFTLPNEGSWNGWHKGGKILYFVYVVKKGGTIPLAYPYLKAVDDAQKNLNALVAKADTTAAYQGGTYTGVKAVAQNFVNFKDTRPSEYMKVASFLINTANNLQARMDVVDSTRVIAYNEGKKFYNDKIANAEWPEMVSLKATLDRLDVLDYGKYSPAEIRDMAVNIKHRMEEVNSKEGLLAFAPAQVKSLKALADTVGVTFSAADADLIAQRLERANSLLESDEALVSILKKAIVAKLYDKIAAGEKVDSLPVTAFFKNPGLFATPKVVERTDKQMPLNWEDLAVADPDGAQIQHVHHQWSNNIPIWVMILEKEYTDLYPGWTVQAFHEGNSMITTGDENYRSYEEGKNAFDAMIGMDWNSRAELKTTLTDLPTGLYTLGVDLVKHKVTGSNPTKQSDISAIVPDSTYTASTSTDGTQKLSVDSVAVSAGTLTADLMLRSQEGWSVADNFFLIFKADDSVNYTALKDAANTALSDALTFVGAAKAKEAKVEYYNINGVKVAAPVNGAVNIKVTTLSDGTRIVQKILVK